MICAAGFLALAAPPSAGPTPPREPDPAGAPVFVGRRHADTTDRRGPYVLAFRRIAGPDPAAGRLFYTVSDAGGAVRSEGETALRRGGPGEAEGRLWTGAIPGQGPGSIVTYHARFRTTDGSDWRHPGREPAEYRFRVVDLRVVSVDLPRPADVESDRAWVRLRIEAAAPPAGEMIVRLHGGSAGDAEERRLPLSIRALRRAGGTPATHEARARLPAIDRGGLANLHFVLRAAPGSVFPVPADAPARTWSIRRPPAIVRPIDDGRAFVLDLAGDDDRHWIGLQGGGLWVEDRAGGARRVVGGTRRIDGEAGALASVARFVLPDPVTGRSYVGTDEGILAIDGAGDAWLPVGSPGPPAPLGSPGGIPGSTGNERAGPGVLSPLDGSLLAQIQRSADPGHSAGVATVVELQDDVVRASTLPTPGLPLIGLSAAGFDAPDGCRLLGGYVRQGSRDRRAAVLRACGGPAAPIALRDPLVEGRPAVPARVVALARQPRGDALIAAIETIVDREDGRSTGYGLFAVDMNTGRLAPAAPGSENVRAEITALAPDWAGGSILAGTIGRGLLRLRDGALQEVALPDGVAGGITALRWEEPAGSILIGTTTGAWTLPAGGESVLPVGPRGGGPSLAGFLPEDLEPGTGRMLLASETGGVITFRRSRDGTPRIDGHLRPGRELPDGSFGDARFLPGGGLAVVVRSRGLFLLEEGGGTLIGPEEGLQGPHLLRLLARRSGEIWVAHLPLPFNAQTGAAVQILRDRAVATTIPLGGRETATIARWVEVPGRDSVMAATAAGVIEFRSDGRLVRLSSSAASAIAHDPAGGAIAVAGTAVERWNGGVFEPLLFALRHPRRPREEFGAGPPIDIAIGRSGVWFLLYTGGLVVAIDPDRGPLGLLERQDGIPRSAARLQADPRSGAIIVGAVSEGPVVIVPRRR